MDEKQFRAIMPYISADLTAMIAKKKGISETEAIQALYSSKLYELLENEETKVWHYSTPMLYSLYEQGERTGTILFPDA